MSVQQQVDQPSGNQQHEVDVRALGPAPLWRRVIVGGAIWIFALDVVLIIVFGLMSPRNVFWSLLNFQNLLLNGAEALLLALAMATLLAAGLIDLSIGVNLVFSSVVGAFTINALVPSMGVTPAIVVGAAACVLAGVLFGLVNGLVIAYLKINSLIATLGTLSIGTGTVLLLTGGGDIGGLPSELQAGFGLHKVFGVIPLPALISIAAAVALWAVFRYLRFGVYTLAIGSSPVSAERAGIRVRRHILKLTMLAGSLAGIAGFVNLAHFGSTTVNGHVNDPLAAITAAVIGGAALAGGRVNIIGTVWGAALALIVLSGLVVIGTSAFWQLIVIGAILLAAVAIDQIRLRRRDSR